MKHDTRSRAIVDSHADARPFCIQHSVSVEIIPVPLVFTLGYIIQGCIHELCRTPECERGRGEGRPRLCRTCAGVRGRWMELGRASACMLRLFVILLHGAGAHSCVAESMGLSEADWTQQSSSWFVDVDSICGATLLPVHLGRGWDIPRPLALFLLHGDAAHSGHTESMDITRVDLARRCRQVRGWLTACT